jgi:hypothetical protein
MNPELLAELEALALKYKTNIYGNVVAFVGDAPSEFAVGEADDAANKPAAETPVEEAAEPASEEKTETAE